MVLRIAFVSLLCWFTLPLQAAPLPANQVFTLKASRIDPNTVRLQWTILSGYMLYKDKFTFKATKQTELGTLHYPKAQRHQDSQGKQYLVYKDNLTLAVPLLSTGPGTAKVTVGYQGCAEAGFCYPPQTRRLELAINKAGAITSVRLAPLPLPALKDSDRSDSDAVTQILSHKTLPLIIISFYVFGLLLAFTPCVLPMVPVLSSMIVGMGHSISTQRAFKLSLSYVLAMSFTYALVGILVALLGRNLQVLMQHPGVIIGFSLLFVLLALSMFGFYELQLPSRLQAKFSNASKRQKNGAYWGAAAMGVLSSLILSPCITAPLVGALSYIASTGNMLLGGCALFFLGLGMGTPLLVIGTSAGKLLPKTGVWMNAVKHFFGVLMLGVAIYLLSRLIPGPVTLLLWGALLIVCSSYLGALQRVGDTQWAKFWQGSGLVLLLYGALLLLGGSLGATSPMHPLSLLVNQPLQTPPLKLPPTPITNEKELNDALAQSKLPVAMLDFYADWCTSCKVMEDTVFNSPEVINQMQSVLWLKADVTHKTPALDALQQQFQVFAPPTFLFFDKEGQEIKSLRITGEKNKAEFLKILKKSRLKTQ